MCGGLGAWFLDFTFHEASVSDYIKRCEFIIKSQIESKAVEWLLSTHYPIYHLSIHIVFSDSLRRRAENTGTKENSLCFYTTSHASLVHKIPPFTNPACRDVGRTPQTPWTLNVSFHYTHSFKHPSKRAS